jgi:L-aspartate oxidase
VQRALHDAVRHDPWIRLIEHAVVLDLLRDKVGRACGVSLHVLGEGTEDGVGAVLARAVVIATGGMGQVFASTTNPVVSTGDGVALALRAGAAVTDIEFVQFHPTAFAFEKDGQRTAQQPLISEALRGEGAHLVDGDGKRFMVGQHDLAELAPRDIVAKAIHRVLAASGADHVYLDGRHVPDIAARFPTITAVCREAGIDPVTELIPVAPAAHYASGGIRTDLQGRSSIAHLYACGEAACTGVHGANRLASNSLLEGLVFARRIAADIAARPPDREEPVLDETPGWVVDATVRLPLQQAMTRGAGVLRSADSLAETGASLETLALTRARPATDTWEVTNLVTVASALVAAASRREETRGCHWREDFPEARPEWLGHLVAAIGPDGRVAERWEPR